MPRVSDSPVETPATEVPASEPGLDVSTGCSWAITLRSAPSGRALTRLEKLALLVVATGGPEGADVNTVADRALTSVRYAQRVLKTLGRDGLVVVVSAGSDAERWTLARPDWDGQQLDDSDKPDATASALVEGLLGEGGILEGFLEDFPDDITLAFRMTLAAATELAEEFSHVSKDVHGYLRNAVIARAVEESGHELTGRDIGRLNREAKVLGADWVVMALFTTASADITGNATSYVIRVARGHAQTARALLDSDAA